MLMVVSSVATQRGTQKESIEVKTKVHSKLNREFAAPVIVTSDELGVMPDDDVMNRLMTLEDERMKVLENRIDPYLWEVEIAYARREWMMRRQRHALHENYLQLQEQEQNESQRLENTYPVADLDNSAFMFFN